jgi:hypothetical protein
MNGLSAAFHLHISVQVVESLKAGFHTMRELSGLIIIDCFHEQHDKIP